MSTGSTLKDASVGEGMLLDPLLCPSAKSALHLIEESFRDEMLVRSLVHLLLLRMVDESDVEGIVEEGAKAADGQSAAALTAQPQTSGFIGERVQGVTTACIEFEEVTYERPVHWTDGLHLAAAPVVLVPERCCPGEDALTKPPADAFLDLLAEVADVVGGEDCLDIRHEAPAA